MPDRREILGLLGVGIAAGLAGVMLSPRLANAPNDIEALRSAKLTDLGGKPRSLQEWQGRILVINFWATWCTPCREEIPALVVVREKLVALGVEIVGIAIDQAAKVAEFARTVQISYPLLLADASGLDLVRKLGNSSGGLPFTVVLDRKGTVAHRNLGAVTQQKIEGQLRPMLGG